MQRRCARRDGGCFKTPAPQLKLGVEPPGKARFHEFLSMDRRIKLKLEKKLLYVCHVCRTAVNCDIVTHIGHNFCCQN